jgi:hypothetical protein
MKVAPAAREQSLLQGARVLQTVAWLGLMGSRNFFKLL